MMRVVVSEFMDETALDAFGADVTVIYEPALVDDRPRLLEAVKGAAAIIVRNRTQVDEELLSSAPDLIAVGRLGVGLDNIDMKACAARNIAVRPATGANSLSVAEYVITAALVLTRGVWFANAQMIAGNWPRNALMGREVSGRVMGLYGFGGIARAVAERARALGMMIAAHDPHLPAGDPAWEGVERCDAVTLLGQADVLSLHVPLTEETRNLIDANAISMMKPGAVLINTARGGVVDEAALVRALEDGRLAGAALDVFAAEPLTAEAAEIFDGIPNLILTPHIAGVTEEGNVRVSSVTVANVIEELQRARA
ncbi:MAG: hydroxyacid dehydrogenase [Hyphomicrobiales bacterium]|nr:hydroxyacid dehydrogenase [Hyphomicrobiales bacterium]